MTNHPEGEKPQDHGSEERPQPRYGAYAPGGSEQKDDAARWSREQTRANAQSPEAMESGKRSEAGSGSQYNPYGQPTWGQPSGSGSDREGFQGAGAPYGQPPGQAPSSSPSAGDPQQPAAQMQARGGRPRRPGTLIGALVLMLAAGVASIVYGVYALNWWTSLDPNEVFSEAEQEEILSEFEENPQMQGMSPEQLFETTLLGFGALALGATALLLALYVTFAFVGTMCGNPGRIIATIYLAGSVFMLLFSFSTIAFALAGLVVLLSIAALVLLWLPPSNKYIAERRRWKEWSRYAQSQYGGGYPGPGGAGQGGPGYGQPGGPGYGQPGGPQGPYGG